jgi:hypothetical protein
MHQENNKKQEQKNKTKQKTTHTKMSLVVCASLLTLTPFFLFCYETALKGALLEFFEITFV